MSVFVLLERCANGQNLSRLSSRVVCIISIISLQITAEYLETHLIKKIDGKLSQPNDKKNLKRMSEVLQLLRNPEAESLSQSLYLPYSIPRRGESSTKSDQIVRSSLMSSFLEIDNEISKLDSTSGSTAVVAVLYKHPLLESGSSAPRKTAFQKIPPRALPTKTAEGQIELKLMVAGTGDSFALLGHLYRFRPQKNDISPWDCILLNREHKPDDLKELSRIKKTGGYVTYTDCPRLNNDLAMSRAFNDNYLKPSGLIADPDIFCFSLDNLHNTPFVVIGSNGVLESFSYNEIIDFVGRGYHEGKTASQISSDLVLQARERSSNDITVIVIYLNPPPCSPPSPYSPSPFLPL